MWFALEIHFQNTKNKMYLYWRSTDFNTLYLTVKDKETGEKKKYKYSGISFRNTETLNRGKRKIASTLTFLGGCFAATNI